MPEGLNSDLNLNPGATPRVMPRVGEWGPVDVPGTRVKRRWRWYAIGAFVLVLSVVVGYGYWIYTMVRG